MKDEEIKEMIINDYKYIVEWAGDEWSNMHEKELERLIKVNFERFKNHLLEHGEISEFQYE